jgi:hypothetical protein
MMRLLRHRIARAAEMAGSGFVALLLAVALAAWWVDDPLLGRSGPSNVLPVFAFLALVPSFVLPLLLLLPSPVPRIAQASVEFACSGACCFFVSVVAIANLTEPRPVLIAGTAVASAIAAFLIGRTSGIRGRIRTLSAAAFVVATCWFAGSITYRHAVMLERSARPPEDEKRHVVLIVIDGMPPRLLHSCDERSLETSFDRLAREGTFFKNAFTERAFTLGYFGLLWGGTDAESTPNATRISDSGIGMEWISFHQNGFPETNLVPGYRGLRSSLLTEQQTWLPRLLGLDYNVALAWPLTKREPARLQSLVEITSPAFDEDTLWHDFVPDEVRRIRSSWDRSMLVVHTSLTAVPTQAGGAGKADEERIRVLTEYAQKHNFEYRSDMEDAARLYAEEYRDRIDRYGDWVARLWHWMESEGFASDTLVIVTADHGSALTGGKLWYGSHVEQEVFRVPMLLLGMPRGISDRRVCTRDVIATVGAIVGVKLNSGSGRNIMDSSIPDRDFVGTQTCPNSSGPKEVPARLAVTGGKSGCWLQLDANRKTILDFCCYDVDGFRQTNARSDPAELPRFRSAFAEYFGIDVDRLPVRLPTKNGWANQ